MEAYAAGEPRVFPPIVLAPDTVQGGFAGGLHQFFEMALLTLLACGVIWLLGEAAFKVGRGQILRRSGSGRLRASLAGLAAIDAGLTRRIAGHTERLARLNDDMDRVRAEGEAAGKALREVQEFLQRPLRVVGNEVTGRSRFYAYVYNRYVEHWKQLGRNHAVLHDSWADPQPVEIWASNEAEAKQLLVERYPASSGFVVIRVMSGEALFHQGNHDA